MSRNMHSKKDIFATIQIQIISLKTLYCCKVYNRKSLTELKYDIFFLPKKWVSTHFFGTKDKYSWYGNVPCLF